MSNVAPLLLIAAGVVLLLVFAAAAVGWAPLIADLLREAGVYLAGLVSLGVTALGVWQAFPDSVKRLTAELLRKVPSLPNALKRRAVQNELEGTLNAALKDFDKEGAGFVEHTVKISWLSPNTDAKEAFFRSDRVYLKLNYSENNERNLVEAALIYCRNALLPTTRQYLSRPLMRAIDLTFIDEILERRRAAASKNYLNHEVVPRELQASPDTAAYLERLSLLCQYGLFVRVFLPELRDYPAYLLGRVANQQHAREIDAFLQFLETTIQNREKGQKSNLLHLGQTIRTAIVLVGMPFKLLEQGTHPYVKAAAIHSDRGSRTVYLLGYSQGIEYVPQIAQELVRRAIASSYTIDEYTPVVHGVVTKHRLARLALIDGAGSRFLQTVTDLGEWPDLEEEGEEDEEMGRKDYPSQ